AIIPSQDDADYTRECTDATGKVVTCRANDQILSVFDEWTPDQVRDVIQSEPLRARLFRKVAIFAGLNRPLGLRDYRKALRKFDGDECEMQAKYPATHVEQMTTGYQINSTELPFDTYQLFQESRRIFILIMVALYFISLSTVFTLLAWGTSCLEINLTFWNFLPSGFLLLSGLGENFFNGTRDTCMIVHSFAVLVGVYVSLPIIGAIVLVRLLDNKASLIACTDVILLTVRNGVPEVVVRLSSASGGMLRNFSVHSHVYFKAYDTTNEKHYLMQQPIEFIGPHKLGHYPSFVKHYCTDDSPLLKHGAIVIDEFGVPSWNPEKLAFIGLSFDADGSKGCDRMFGYHPRTFIQPNKKGQMPFFVNSCPVSHFHWLKYKGEVSPFSDLSRLSKWEYIEKDASRSEAEASDRRRTSGSTVSAPAKLPKDGSASSSSTNRLTRLLSEMFRVPPQFMYVRCSTLLARISATRKASNFPTAIQSQHENSPAIVERIVTATRKRRKHPGNGGQNSGSCGRETARLEGMSGVTPNCRRRRAAEGGEGKHIARQASNNHERVSGQQSQADNQKQRRVNPFKSILQKVVERGRRIFSPKLLAQVKFCLAEKGGRNNPRRGGERGRDDKAPPGLPLSTAKIHPKEKGPRARGTYPKDLDRDTHGREGRTMSSSSAVAMSADPIHSRPPSASASSSSTPPPPRSVPPCACCGHARPDVVVSGCPGGCAYHARCLDLAALIRAQGNTTSHGKSVAVHRCPGCGSSCNGLAMLPLDFREMDAAQKGTSSSGGRDRSAPSSSSSGAASSSGGPPPRRRPGEQAPSRPAPHVGSRAGRVLLRPQRPPGREVESGGDRLPRRADTALRRGQPPPEQRTEAHRLPKPDAQVEAVPPHEEDEARPPQHTALPHGHRVHTRPEQGGLPLGARGLLRQLHRRRRRADRDTVPHGTGVAGSHRGTADLHEDRVRRVRVAQERRRHGEEDRPRDE
ncbi:hypothetical protein THAOC_06738, partial [Thalassiosira oceanica]